MKSAEKVAQELADLSTTPRIIYAEVLAIVRRDRRERAQAVLPMVKAVVERHRDFPSEGRSAKFDGPYEYGVHIWVSSDTLEAAARWLAAQQVVRIPFDLSFGTCYRVAG